MQNSRFQFQVEVDDVVALTAFLLDAASVAWQDVEVAHIGYGLPSSEEVGDVMLGELNEMVLRSGSAYNTTPRQRGGAIIRRPTLVAGLLMLVVVLAASGILTSAVTGFAGSAVSASMQSLLQELRASYTTARAQASTWQRVANTVIDRPLHAVSPSWHQLVRGSKPLVIARQAIASAQTVKRAANSCAGRLGCTPSSAVRMMDGYCAVTRSMVAAWKPGVMSKIACAASPIVANVAQRLIPVLDVASGVGLAGVGTANLAYGLTAGRADHIRLGCYRMTAGIWRTVTNVASAVPSLATSAHVLGVGALLWPLLDGLLFGPAPVDERAVLQARNDILSNRPLSPDSEAVLARIAEAMTNIQIPPPSTGALSIGASTMQARGQSAKTTLAVVNVARVPQQQTRLSRSNSANSTQATVVRTPTQTQSQRPPRTRSANSAQASSTSSSTKRARAQSSRVQVQAQAAQTRRRSARVAAQRQTATPTRGGAAA